jgi:hypothetical protein
MGSDSVEFDLEDARASLVAHDFHLDDYTDLVNSVRGGPSKPATVSFDIEWAGLLDRVKVDASNNKGFGSHDWGGRFAITGARVSWSGETADFSFESDPANTSQNQFAIMGEERNGVFFRSGGGEGDEGD